MTEASRVKGIEVYTRYIQLYALQALAARSIGEGMRIDVSAADMPAHAVSVLADAASGRRTRCCGTLPGAPPCVFPDASAVFAFVTWSLNARTKAFVGDESA